MRSYSAISALRARLKAGRLTPIPAHHPDQFTVNAWSAESRLRESCDALAGSHWYVVWIPAEPGPVVPRRFWLRGTHSQITARAKAMFPCGVVVIEAARFDGPERFDTRLNQIGRTQ